MRSLLVSNSSAPFVMEDLRFLRSRSPTSFMKYSGRRHLPGLFFRAMCADLVFSWFGLGYADTLRGLQLIRGYRTVVNVGGWETMDLAEVGYGAILNPRFRQRFIRTVRAADDVLTVSEFTADHVEAATGRRPVVIYQGLGPLPDPPEWGTRVGVVMVAPLTKAGLLVKGIADLIAVARGLPNLVFTIIGKSDPEVVADLNPPANVTCTGVIGNAELIHRLSLARVIVQPSRVESFGRAAVEGAAVGCQPVISRGGALPEVFADRGHYFEYGDREGLTAAIQTAHAEGHPGDASWFRETYSRERRDRELGHIIPLA